MAKKMDKKKVKTSVSRRSLLKKGAAAALTISPLPPMMEHMAKAQQANTDEHFFIFLELVGGAHFMIATDGRDPSQLPLDDKTKVAALEITNQAPDNNLLGQWSADSNYESLKALGDFIVLPYIDDITSSYYVGQTNLGAKYVLGPSGQGLKSVVDDMAVVRGVRMQGTFHPRSEIFSGNDSPDFPHIASVISQLLENKYGSAPHLDNLGLEGPMFNKTGTPGTKLPISATGKSLSTLSQLLKGEVSGRQRIFTHALKLSEALSKGRLTEGQREVFTSYMQALPGGPRYIRDLSGFNFNDADISLDLEKQFYVATRLINAGLSRVITLCLGAPNGINKVDSFGLFDSHQGLYHDNENNANVGSHKQHIFLGNTMDQIAAFIKTLKSTPFRNTNKSLFDMTTVVVGSDYARTSNLNGNDSYVQSGPNAFGNGHNWLNNNYILFGKGIKGGSWIGNTDPIIQVGDHVDMSSLASNDLKDIVTSSSLDASRKYIDAGYYSNKRTFMVKDILKTVLASAGFEGEFDKYYNKFTYANAKTIKCLLA